MLNQKKNEAFQLQQQIMVVLTLMSVLHVLLQAAPEKTTVWSSFKQTMNCSYRPSKVWNFVYLPPISLNRCVLRDIIVHDLITVKIYILEPTQIYRFLRTRNMVSVSISNNIVFSVANTYILIFSCHSGMKLIIEYP